MKIRRFRFQKYSRATTRRLYDRLGNAVVYATFLLMPLVTAVGCGGGEGNLSGNGSVPNAGPTASTVPTAPATGSTAPGAVVTASPTPTPTPIVQTDTKGVLVDDISGQPIVGATVIVSGTTVIAGATPPPSGTPWPSATSAADGSFDLKGVVPSSWTMDFSYVGSGYPVYPHAQWIEAFSPDGHAAYHGIWSLNTAGTTDVGTVAIAMPSSTDLAWLAQVNSDRATIGVPAVTVPLSFDSVTLESTRYWAQQMASYPFFGHQCPSGDTSCEAFWLWQTQHHSLPSAQNISWNDPAWPVAEHQFMSEISNCPNGGNWQTCPYSETTGHYINIMSATFWAGVASATGTGSSGLYYAENFTSPVGIAASISDLRRSLAVL